MEEGLERGQAEGDAKKPLGVGMKVRKSKKGGRQEKVVKKLREGSVPMT